MLQTRPHAIHFKPILDCGEGQLGRAVSSLVFGVPVRDPLTFTGVAMVLAGVALAACAIPAPRVAHQSHRSAAL